MSREIKFRAYDTERNMYVPQGEIIFKDYGETYFEVSPNCQEYIYDKCHNGESQNNRFIIEQFTGLADEYGIDIYEGDALISPLGEIFKIKWINSMFILKNREGITRGIHYNLNMWKVIGNIHEKPELLNQPI